MYDFSNPTAYFVAWRTIYIFVGLSALFYFGSIGISGIFLAFPGCKEPGADHPCGSLIAFGPIVFWCYTHRSEEYLIHSVNALIQSCAPNLSIAFPLANGYVILRFRLLRTDYWLRQGMVYAMLTILCDRRLWLAG